MADAPEGREYASWAKYRSAWWTKYFGGELARFWPSYLDDLRQDEDGYCWLTRDDVFAIAAARSSSWELHTAVAGYVWGIGKNAFLISRMVRAFTTNAGSVEQNLQAGAAILARDGVIAAYDAMKPGGVARTRFMGPAYFTKFLFFAGGRVRGVDGLHPLVLDKWVATALRARGIFAPGVGDSGWSTELYRRYLVYCQEQDPADPESVEVELFGEGRSSRNRYSRGLQGAWQGGDGGRAASRSRPAGRGPC